MAMRQIVAGAFGHTEASGALVAFCMTEDVAIGEVITDAASRMDSYERT